jgi:hypothetical protein
MVTWRIAGAGALLIMGIVCTQAVGSVFAAAVETPAASGAGIVTLSDDRQSAMFGMSDLKPGDQQIQDITVKYAGSAIPTEVMLYVSPADLTGSGLEKYLQLTIERGSLSVTDGVEIFSGSVVFSGTLDAFGKLHTSYADGAGLWIVDHPGESTTFRITVMLQDDNRAQGLDATVAFTWEAQTR